MMKARMTNPVMVLPDAMKALLALSKAAQSGTVPQTTHTLIHLRVSQINGCGVCVDMHSRELKHSGEKDERIPMAQNLELHMALKQRGVPTEFLVYPGQPHGLQESRYQLVKMMAELGWFEHWIRGRAWFSWEELLAQADRIAGKTGAVAAPSAVSR